MKSNTKKIKKVAKKVKKTAKKVNAVRAHDAGDNIKWNIDFRTAVDNIDYKMTDGSHNKNGAVLTNRLYLNMKYKADDKVTFYGTLAYNKLYGATTGSANSKSSFDWITNESATTDSNLKVKEAYWLYANDTFMGKDISWTASIGRRPSTDGLGINFREGQKAKSAIASTVNVEFDGASFRWNIDQVTPLTGAWFKICMGRGITNAKTRFSGTDYTKQSTLTDHSNMVGVIFVPYDDGQYSVWTNYAKANHLIGYDTKTPTATTPFSDMGGIDLSTVMFKAEGIGNEINDFLDNTIFFASYSQSKTNPTNPKGMLGSTESKTGHSFWVGVQMPCPITDDGRLGIEWNKGSKYWRSMTYAEDTMVGSKIAARGTATEVYWLKPLTSSLSLNLRYTHINYNYAGSNGFFGEGGDPDGTQTVDSATDIRAAISYRF